MSYKILHFSDLNLDASFAGQGFPAEFGNARRLALRAVLKSIVTRAKELKVDTVTIGGNLFVQEYITPETIEFVQQQFAALAPVQVIISPGSNDPYTNDSIYARFDLPDNVDIFYRNDLAHNELSPGMHIWGACNPPARGRRILDGFQPSKGTNVLLLHAARAKSDKDIHVIDIDEVKRAGFSLALLGGENVLDEFYAANPQVIYPGSPDLLEPEEVNKVHQAYLVEINGEVISSSPISFQRWRYENLTVDITNYFSTSDVAHSIESAIKKNEKSYSNVAVKVTLTGIPKFDLDVDVLQKMIDISTFFCLESQLELGYDLENLAAEQTVRGLLVRRFKDRISKSASQTERYELLLALRFALQALDGKQVSLHEIKKN